MYNNFSNTITVPLTRLLCPSMSSRRDLKWWLQKERQGTFHRGCRTRWEIRKFVSDFSPGCHTAVLPLLLDSRGSFLDIPSAAMTWPSVSMTHKDSDRCMVRVKISQEYMTLWLSYLTFIYIKDKKYHTVWYTGNKNPFYKQPTI